MVTTIMESIVHLCRVFINDKILVILCATAIAMVAMIKGCSAEAKDIVVPIITGLMGVAVGRGTNTPTNGNGTKKEGGTV